MDIAHYCSERLHWYMSPGSMSEPVMRYMAEQAWRKDGRLGILVDALCITALFTNSQQYVLLQMQRVTQMHIVPDLLAIIDPDVDMSISVKEGRSVVPGSYLLASQVYKIGMWYVK